MSSETYSELDKNWLKAQVAKHPQIPPSFLVIYKMVEDKKKEVAAKKVKANAAENAVAADAMMKRANALAIAAAKEFRASTAARAASGLPPLNKTRGGRRQRRSRTRSNRRMSTTRKRK